MNWLNESFHSISAAFGLLAHDKLALEKFRISLVSFWHSFSAVIFVAPLYFFISASDLANQKAAQISFGLISLKLLVQWVVWLAVMGFVCKQINLAAKYVRYVIVYNWTNVVVMVLIVMPTIGYQLEFMEKSQALFLTGVLQLFSFYFAWYVTRISLATNGLIAGAIVLGDFVLSLTILQLLG